MTTRLFNILLALLALSTLNSQLATAHAQGSAFTYNGLLQNGSGPQSGSFDFMFTLYNVATLGTPVTAVTIPSVAVKTGAFTVTLDFGATVWNGQDYWLEIAMKAHGDPAYNTLAPRQEILPTPYAIYAETANNFIGTLSFSQLTGTIDNSQLANSSFTVNTGPELSGGQQVALGGTITLGIASGGVNNSMLANPNITINTGTGLSGGNTVALGGAFTLNNTGVTSLTGGDGVTVSAATGDLTLGLGSTLSLPVAPVTVISGMYLLMYADNNQNYFAGLAAGNTTMSGDGNTGLGDFTLSQNASGSENAAFGDGALAENTQGYGSTAIGAQALLHNTTGNLNTAVGYNSMEFNVLGNQNVGLGYNALYTPTNGNYNVAVGYGALESLGAYPWSGGSNNIALGYYAGGNLNANESSNIDIGNLGVAGENNITRIGTTQTAAYIAGIITGNGSGLTSINGSQITGGTINNSQLANSSITVLAGAGLTGGGTFALGGSTMLSVAPGSVNNSMLANSSITIAPGTGLGGGGPVALGGSIILNNTGVTSLTGGGGVTVSAPSGAVTLGSTATSANTPNTIVSRDGTGSFSAQSLTLAGILNLPAPSVTINSGANSLLLGDVHDNLFLGLAAGNSTATGAQNTGVGAAALGANTTGYGNVANGYQALYHNADGFNNTANGYQALFSNTSGFDNVANGWQSLLDNTTGWYNTADGIWALQANTAGNNNTAVGYDALGGNTTGTQNTAYGVHANLYNTTGSNNVAVGFWSLNYCTGGSGNIALGYQAGINFSGSESGNIDIGNAGKPGDNDVIRIGTPGIQTTTSLAGICNSHVGYGCLQGTAGTLFGNTFNFWWTTNNQLQAWVDNIAVGVVMFTSDRRLKENIQPMTDDALTRVMALKPSTFKYKNIPGTVFQGDGTKEEGFIADELQQVIPSAVNGQTNAVTSNGTIQPQTVNLMPLVAVLTKAVQEQQQEINDLKAQIKTLSEHN